MIYARPKGTEDVYGARMEAWLAVEEEIRGLCLAYNIREIRTPMYESVELYRRSTGETSDIVTKEMFTFTDAGGRTFALRPEGTPGVARAFIENGMSSLPMPQKYFYIMPVFRAEKPQKGRLRQHTQFGVEYLGADGPDSDAELISVAYGIIKRLGIRSGSLKINSLGGQECRKRYNSVLTAFIGDNIDKLCPDCRSRFDRNPLRALDCKNTDCAAVMAEAPTSVSVLGKECLAHFQGVQESLTNLGIPFVVDSKLVRGLDYYTRTVFEIVSTDLGAQDALCGGGRYDGLVTGIGGPNTPAVGFGMGIERLLIAMNQEQADAKPGPVYVGHIGDEGRLAAGKLTQTLRDAGISAERDLLGRSVKAQMKAADKLASPFSMIIGADEAAGGTVSIKNMTSGETAGVNINEIVRFIKERM